MCRPCHFRVSVDPSGKMGPAHAVDPLCVEKCHLHIYSKRPSLELYGHPFDQSPLQKVKVSLGHFSWIFVQHCLHPIH